MTSNKNSAVQLSPDAILHEDEWVVVVDKPSGLPTHMTRDPARDHLLRAVARLLEARDGAAPPLFAVHRLDVGTSGVVVLARKPEANLPLSEAFARRDVLKIYDAIVFAGDRAVEERFTVERYLKAKGRRTSVVRSGGKPSRTDFVLVERRGDRCLLEARPRTGRMHQIRIHLADSALPILGDALYGSRPAHADRLMLHARRVRLPHPSGKGELDVTAPTPDALKRALG
jgi:RluA family pseudouridine synthase